MKKNKFNIIYLIVMILIISLFIFFKNLDDTLQFIFGALAIILTSIFTYSNRRRKE